MSLSATGTNAPGILWPKASMTSDVLPTPYVTTDQTGGAGSFPPWNVFSPPGYTTKSGLEWYTASSSGWLTIDMGAGNAFVPYSYNINCFNNPAGATFCPTAWQFQGSNDGSTWTTLDTQSSQGSNTHVDGGATYVVVGNVTAYRYYKLNITASGAGGAFEIESFGITQSSGTAVSHPLAALTADSLSPTPYTAAASSEFDATTHGAWNPFANAFNGAFSNEWAAGGSSTTPWWISLDIGPYYAGTCTSYKLAASGAMAPGNGPKSWTFQGSNDNSSWTTLDTQTNHAALSTSVATTFNVSGAASFRYYRLNITALQSSTTEAELGYFSIQIGGATYPINTMYYITTKSGASNIDLRRYAGGSITAVTITNSVPSGGTLVGFVSFDDGNTWYYWNGSAWTLITLSDANLTAHGMTMTTIQTQLTAALSTFPGTVSSLAFAFGFETTILTNTPAVSGISITFQAAASLAPASWGSYLDSVNIGVRRLDSKNTYLKNLTVGSLSIYATIDVLPA